MREQPEVFPITISMRSYLSTQHLWMARHCTQLARDYEDRYRAQRPLFHIHQRGYVLAAITESVAFIEALINELFTDVSDGHAEERLVVFDESARYRMKQYWKATNRRTVSILEKYHMALLLNDRAPYDRGAEPYQSVAALIDLRNWLVHYYPEDVSADIEHRFEKRLKGRFEANMLMAGSGNAWFPDHALGAGCAAWSVSAAELFANDFVEGFGYNPNYRQVNYPVDPPELV